MAQPILPKFGMWLDTHQSNDLEESEVESLHACARAYFIFEFEEFPGL